MKYIILYCSILLGVFLHGCASSTLVTPIGNISYEPSFSPVVGIDAAGGGSLGVGLSGNPFKTGDSIYVNTDQNIKNLQSVSEQFLPQPIEMEDLQFSTTSNPIRLEPSSSRWINVATPPVDTSVEFFPDRVTSLTKQKELTLLTMCIYGEARSEPYQGKLAIASVVMNRVSLGGWYGNSVKEVLLKPYQFSCFNRRDPNFPKLFKPQQKLWNLCFKAAWNAYSKLSQDPTDGANHYCRHDISPPWIKRMKKTKRIGDHEFFRFPQQAMRDMWETYSNTPGIMRTILQNKQWQNEFNKIDYLIRTHQGTLNEPVETPPMQVSYIH